MGEVFKININASKAWEVSGGPAKGHLDTQLFPECAGKWCDRDIVKKNRRRRKRVKKASKDVNPRIRMIRSLEGITVWQVDGEMIRDDLDEEFTNFGQHYRFDFIPKDEFWIDHEENDDEIGIFIDHLLVEHDLMSKGMGYDKAIEKADAKEKKERAKKASEEEDKDIHKSKWGVTDDGATVWIVDGTVVRDLYDIDFVEGGHDRVYDFVPINEVWIEDDVKEEERPFVLLHELHERGLMGEGMDYEKAHQSSSDIEHKCRKDPDLLDKSLRDEGWDHGKVVKKASLEPSVDRMLSEYADRYVKALQVMPEVREWVPEEDIGSFSMDSLALAAEWGKAVDRFLGFYPQDNIMDVTRRALEWGDLSSDPMAERLHYSYLVPATSKCVRDALRDIRAGKDVADTSPRWVPVESSFISEVSYNDGLEFLDVRLKDGREFTFRGISPEGYDEFMSSPSKGEAFNRMLRTRKAGCINWYVKAMAARRDMSAVTPEQWDEIGRRLDAMGFDIRGADDVRNLYVERLDGKISGDHKRAFDAVINGREYVRDVEPDMMDKVFSKAVGYFGTTTDMREAGYILPNGILLDLSGKKQGGSRGTRALDHRDVNFFFNGTGRKTIEDTSSSTRIMMDFVRLGAIRYFPERPGIYAGREPTRAQLDIINADVNNSGDGYIVEIVDPVRGRLYKEYDPGTKPAKVISDILTHYGNGRSIAAARQVK